ncbi:hypothetical protein [uncultured Cellulomonas sp.]|uniref:hypothetical protein n=1 Tax=uncultured Cellulomonas sp. TaxID=189682 RepID=UPI002620A439|nr:hypothetical protein [uncultured Cellulomonas sp.]
MTGRTEGVSLLLPAAYDVAWSLAVVVHLGLLFVALVRWNGARATPGAPGAGLVDLLVVVLVPVLGPAAYLVGRRAAGSGRRADAGPTGS